MTSTTTGKLLRADAARNREKLLEIATAAFAERGSDASLDEIARTAGVGIGTLYRHFPTREDLVLAVYGRQIDALDSRSLELSQADDPATALHEWMHGFVDYYAVKNGMVTLLRSMMNDGRSVPFEQARETLRTATERMLRPAIDAGEIRADVGAPELLRALGGICLSAGGPGGPATADPKTTLALVDLVFDGLRYGASKKS